MGTDRSRFRDWERASAFAVGAALDVLVCPFAVLGGRRRVARRVCAAAGMPPRGVLRADLAHARLRRLHRRLRHRLQRFGPGEIVGQLDVEGESRLPMARAAGRGVLLLGTHGGPPWALSAALRVLGIDALHVRQAAAPPWDPPVRTVVLDGTLGTEGRARGLMECLDELRRGGAVVFPLEGPFGERRTTIRVEGVRVQAALGGAVLSRLSGAAALPVIADVGASGRVLLRIGARLPPPSGGTAGDEEWVRGAAAAFDALLLDRPPVRRFERLYQTLRFSHAALERAERRAPAEATA